MGKTRAELEKEVGAYDTEKLANCEQMGAEQVRYWKEAVTTEEDSWWVDDDAVAEYRQNIADWELHLAVCRAELKKRRAAAPAETRQTEGKVAEEWTARREETRDFIEDVEKRYSLGGQLKTAWHKAVVTHVADAFGMGENQTPGERAAGYVKLVVAVVAASLMGYLLYRVAAAGYAITKANILEAQRKSKALATTLAKAHGLPGA